MILCDKGTFFVCYSNLIVDVITNKIKAHIGYALKAASQGELSLSPFKICLGNIRSQL